MVRFGSVPVIISNSLVSSTQSMEAERFGRSQSLKPFKKGDNVTIQSGPFAGGGVTLHQTALYQGLSICEYS